MNYAKAVIPKLLRRRMHRRSQCLRAPTPAQAGVSEGIRRGGLLGVLVRSARIRDILIHPESRGDLGLSVSKRAEACRRTLDAVFVAAAVASRTVRELSILSR